MAFLVSSVPVNILAIAGLVAPCISQHFLETSGFPASGASCLRRIVQSHFPTQGEAFLYLCLLLLWPMCVLMLFYLLSGVFKLVQLRVCPVSFFVYVVNISIRHPF